MSSSASSFTSSPLEPQKYECYGCGSVVFHEQLRYECMCRKKNGNVGGVCKKCEGKKLDEMTNLPVDFAQHHNLRKVHTFTQEYEKYLVDVEIEMKGHTWFIAHQKSETITFSSRTDTS